MSRLLRTPESHAGLATPEVKVLDIDTLRIFETFYPELGPERGEQAVEGFGHGILFLRGGWRNVLGQA